MFVLAAALARGQTTSPANEPIVTQDYVLGPGDQITIRAQDVEELSDKPVRIATNGFVTLPVVGRVKAAGLTTEELENILAKDLTVLVKKPQVSVSVIETQSQPVSVLGEVKSPGMYQLQGRKTLVQVLSMAGGPQETAGYCVRITRRSQFGLIPIPGATLESGGAYSSASVPLRDIMTGNMRAENILIMPNDVITVPRADVVYVIGDVGKAGSIAVGEQQNITALQALSMAGGAMKTAKPSEAKILRLEPGQSRRKEIPVNLKLMLSGQASDFSMQSEDILFVPDNKPHSVAMKALESALQVGTGVAILSASHY